jgi:DNA-binding LytR/AlgR family response regulator
MPEKSITCIVVDDEPPALEILRKYIAQVQSLKLEATFTDAIDAFNFLQQHPVELIFLDIKMPELLGTDLVRTLKRPPAVIFTTAYRKYAVEGFDLDAVDYLLKPVSFERFLKAVNKIEPASIESAPKSPAQFIQVRTDRNIVKVQINEILYIESLKDYIKVVTQNASVVTKVSISAIEANLPKDQFLRIHRSFIVSLDKIESFSHELVWIAKTELPVGRMYRQQVEAALNPR